MNEYDKGHARREVQQLQQLAMDAKNEAQYTTMERLLEHAVSLAERLDDLPLLIKERYWLATAQRMQGKNIQALATYSWLIGLANDRNSSPLLADADTLWYLEGGYRNFVACGRFLPQMPVQQLLRVVAEGLDWLQRVGQPHWAAGLRLQKGNLLKNQGNRHEARLEMESALALKRRTPQAPGFPLATHQLQLADILCQSPEPDYEEALLLAQEVLVATTSTSYDQWWAQRTLAYSYLGKQDYEAAAQAAQQSLHLAQMTQSPSSVANAYQVLGRIERERGRPAQAAQAVAQQWHWSRRTGSAEYYEVALTDCARVRLLQAREAAGLSVTENTLPEGVPHGVNRSLALRRVRSVSRLLNWAAPLAQRLDQARGDRAFSKQWRSCVNEPISLTSGCAKPECTPLLKKGKTDAFIMTGRPLSYGTSIFFDETRSLVRHCF